MTKEESDSITAARRMVAAWADHALKTLYTRTLLALTRLNRLRLSDLPNADALQRRCVFLSTTWDEIVSPVAKFAGFDEKCAQTVGDAYYSLLTAVELSPPLGSGASAHDVAQARLECRSTTLALARWVQTKSEKQNRGRPPKTDLVEEEYERRSAAGEFGGRQSAASIAIDLRRWQEINHPNEPLPADETIRRMVGTKKKAEMEGRKRR